MDFGKVARIDLLERIDFRLPPLEARSVQLLSSLKSSGNLPRVYIGCPVWSKKEWIGKVYPSKTSSKDFLKYYSKQFNTIELNTTFYRIPPLSTVENWRKTVQPGFKFCPKFFQGVSHQSDLVTVRNLIQQFSESILNFKEALGISFLQLPPYFGLDQIALLEKFLGALPVGFRVAVEFRHPSWFEKNMLKPEAYAILAHYQASTVITDVAGRRDVLHGSLTSSSVLVRFVGNSLHPTDILRIHDWIIRIEDWIKAGVEEFYFFVHQPNDETSPELIQYLTDHLNQRVNLGLRTWVSVKDSQGPEQMELF